MRKFIALIVLLCSSTVNAEGRKSHLLSVGQGYVSPSVTSTINFSNGFSAQNPVGVVYQEGARLSGHFAQNGYDKYGGELGYGANGWGIAVGYLEHDCEDCESDPVGTVGLTVGSSFSFGLRMQEEIYGAGLVLFPNSNFRIGIVGQLYDPEGDDNNITAVGAGLGWFSQQWAFVVDASKNTYENDALEDDRMLVTPGLLLQVDILQISLNYDIIVDDEDDETEDDDDDVWFGVGIGGQQYHLAFYSDYVDDVAFSLSVFF